MGTQAVYISVIKPLNFRRNWAIGLSPDHCKPWNYSIQPANTTVLPSSDKTSIADHSCCKPSTTVISPPVRSTVVNRVWLSEPAIYSCCAPDRRDGRSKRWFCPSVAYIANNTRTQRLIVPKFGMKVPHLRCYSDTSFNVKRSKIRVTDGRGHTVSAEPVACCALCWRRGPASVRGAKLLRTAWQTLHLTR